MKSILSPSVLVAFVAFLFCQASTLSAATTDTKAKKIPFHGKLQSVDTSANTVTLAGKKATRVFHVTAETKITDGAGSPATLSSGVAGEDVGGSYSKDGSGEMMLNSLRLGAKTGTKEAAATPASAATATPPAAPAAAPEVAPIASATAPTPSATPAPAPAPAANMMSTKARKERFSGTVVSVDASANTMVVHGKADQTFTVTSSTKMTGASGLASIAAGAKVSGSYEKSADGATLTVATLKVK